MSFKLSNRVKRVKPSFTLQMATKAAEMRDEGIDVINFSVGEPDFNTPEHIIDAAKIAMDKGLKFAIREGGKTVGAGVVTEIIE